MHLDAARVADDGSLLLLSAQDRVKWDRAQIRRGLAHLARSAAGETVTRYHLEAGLAAALAPNHEATNWPHILDLYDALLDLDASPVVALNRAVALAQVRGPEPGLAARWNGIICFTRCAGACCRRLDGNPRRSRYLNMHSPSPRCQRRKLFCIVN